jgi:hypothetical protein
VRLAAALSAALLLAACAQESRQSARVTAHPAISALEVMPAPIRNGTSGAPTQGVTISGTITNTGSTALRCRPTEFLLVDGNGNAIAPTSQWCAVPSIGPQQSGTFNATFSTSQSAHLELRFEHPDGTYEAHRLTLPPA